MMDHRGVRVGVITTSYPRWPGDPAGNFVAGQVDWLLRAGHQVDVVCAASAARPGLGQLAQEHRDPRPGIRIYPVPAPSGLFYQGGAPDSLAANPWAAVAAARFCAALAAALYHRARTWDAAFAHWLVPSAAALAVVGPPELPVVAIAHSGDVHLLRQLGLTTPLASLLVARRTRLVFVSRYLRDRFLARVWPARLCQAVDRTALITPMGVHVARFRAAAAAHQSPAADLAAPAPGPMSRRANRNPRVRARTVLFLGRLVPIKGAAVLLDAVAQLAPGLGPVRLIVAGSGPCRRALRAQAQTLCARGRSHSGLALEVDFPGQVCGSARDRLLAGADVLVLPSIPVASAVLGSRSEGAPVTVLEAMAAGVPVIASRTGGLAELPPDVVTLVPPGVPAALTRALTQCLTATDARGDRRVRAASTWVEQYDWSHVGARIWAHGRL